MKQKVVYSLLAVAVAGQLGSNVAFAADIITGGSYTLTLSNQALQVGQGSDDWYISNSYDNTFNNVSLKSDPPVAGGSTWGYNDTVSLTSAVNSYGATTSNTATDRTVQASTLDPSTLVNGVAGVGQIGLSGAFYLNSETVNKATGYAYNYYLLQEDFSLVNNGSYWSLQTNDLASRSYPFSFLELTNVTQTLTGNEFTLSANVTWDPNPAAPGDAWWGDQLGNATDANLTALVNLGTFNLTANLAPAPVPVPGAVWLFSSALAGLGMLGGQRRKQA